MNRNLCAFCGLLAACLLLTSCLNSSDDDVTTYNNTAIKSFALGTLNRYLHTKTSSGKDSVYKSTYPATTYKMNIDQLNHRISNADSLLMGTDVKHVVCTVTTSNNGVVFVKSMTSDTLFYLNSGKDSVDFSKPRVLRVFAADGSGYRDYTVSLSVRQQNAGSFKWVEAEKGSFPDDADDTLRQRAKEAGMNYLGRTAPEAYAIGADGLLKESEDDGKTWSDDLLDTDAKWLPNKNVAFVSWQLDYKTDYALLAGQSDMAEKAMVLWRKLADDDGGGRWVYMPLDDANPYYLPRLDKVELVYYDDIVLAFGSNKKVYQSRDQGITWKVTTLYSLPSEVGANTFRVCSDEDDYLWVTDTASGRTWKGKLTE